jgi:multidrug efflux pump subunit AcrA (membrane-fusion protein)
VQLTAEPPARQGRSTSRILFQLAASAAALAPGDVGWVKLAARSREHVAVPSSAVLNSSQGPYVLAASADGRTFERRTLEIGRTVSGFTVVLSGLRDEERVIVGNAFFLDAERRGSEREAVVGASQ